MRFTVLRSAYGPEEKAYLTCKALQLRDHEWAEYNEAEQLQLADLALWDKVSAAVLYSHCLRLVHVSLPEALTLRPP